MKNNLLFTEVQRILHVLTQQLMSKNGEKVFEQLKLFVNKQNPFPKQELDVLNFTIEGEGSLAPTHNFPCPVCMKEPAVLETWSGAFAPCWKCQNKGHHLVSLNQGLPWWFPRRLWRHFLRNKNAHAMSCVATSTAQAE